MVVLVVNAVWVCVGVWLLGWWWVFMGCCVYLCWSWLVLLILGLVFWLGFGVLVVVWVLGDCFNLLGLGIVTRWCLFVFFCFDITRVGCLLAVFCSWMLFDCVCLFGWLVVLVGLLLFVCVGCLLDCC